MPLETLAAYIMDQRIVNIPVPGDDDRDQLVASALPPSEVRGPSFQEPGTLMLRDPQVPGTGSTWNAHLDER